LSRRAVAGVACALAVAGACQRAPSEPLITYFNADHGVSLRYPSSWHSEQAEQAGVWYRYFLGPPTGPQRKPAVSVTLLVGALAGEVDEYAQSYLAGNQLVSSRPESRGGVNGKAYEFQSADGATRHSLLLLKDGGTVYGLYAQGETPLYEQRAAVLGEIARSLTFERPADYPERRNERFGFSLRVPPSWTETRSFSGGESLLVQYRSPALAADRDRDPVHAALTLSVEPIRKDEGLEDYYQATRAKLGDSFQILSHARWTGGYADVMRVETPVTASRVKRFYRASPGRGFSLNFEAREDVYPRVSKFK
jgi:hypothetical protein